ncbi:MAG: universal stress protein [Haloarculaceae archaeon]
MRVLVPIDGSPTSEKALRFGVGFADNYDADLDVVHITDQRDDASEEVVDAARTVLLDAGAGASVDPELLERPDLDGHGAEAKVGEHVLDLVEERGYDHVVMGRHGGAGRLEQLVLGSATKEVVTGSETPVTVVPYSSH